jgi:hypothetical protein
VGAPTKISLLQHAGPSKHAAAMVVNHLLVLEKKLGK